MLFLGLLVLWLVLLMVVDTIEQYELEKKSKEESDYIRYTLNKYL